MAQAGVTRIQPGIESLSSNVLRLMRKGVRAIQNVNLLRWAQYYDICVDWNLLWGFPGETEQDYTDQAAAIPHLLHLPPPASANRIWLERFSPLFTEHDTFRLRRRTPEPSYRYVYPGNVDIERVAYFFDYDLDGGLPDSAYAGRRPGGGGLVPGLAGGPAAGADVLVSTSLHPDLRRKEAGARGDLHVRGHARRLVPSMQPSADHRRCCPARTGPGTAGGSDQGTVRGVPEAWPDVCRWSTRARARAARSEGPVGPDEHG